ncbi:uncharacterized protein PHACADRAFT_213112 [Phanerochaete carnosa HHB-10118-sp]|uniref:Uncharacterized protein n=1 Tax=Phanerochaete carnosa (strain HHB-10118-sp) TaxID=650164 RepID=K5VIX5_PHACS|nr:uncharacterized protein PHACADRAFT_213112 [Phanerochaete carnosa HHB-10118-sp]EKM51248.1 hypothetical protein PHACADRAFT_213112 [Phanerochaete carnosa HHB-10118-sp]
MKKLWIAACYACCLHATAAFRPVGSTTLGQDPQTVNRLNGESFQQDPLVTLNGMLWDAILAIQYSSDLGYQYAVFWTADATNASIRHASVSRRDLRMSSLWETFTLSDYNQSDDDGHDVISLGISQGDGTLHIGFDQHDNDLRYRISKSGVATNPSVIEWTADIFGPTLDYLPGLEFLDKSVYFINITYPRFLNIPSNARPSGSDLLLELRVGRSGLGDDWLYTYTPNRGWNQVGRYLEGVNNNAYINGLDFDSHGLLHTTWTYRDYVNDTGQDVAVEAGPNGPENNHDMDYAFSHDLGTIWLNNWGQQIANTTAEEPVVPISAGITIFSIPKYGGILNQEAQTIDNEGRIHVLNRENTTGVERWYHYWRSTTAAWIRTPLPPSSELYSVNNITGTPTVIGKRGKLVVPPSGPSSGMLFAILPSNAPNSSALSVLASTAAGHFRDWLVLWEVPSGCVAEPLFDRTRLREDGVLSLYLVNGTEVQVADFEF